VNSVTSMGHMVVDVDVSAGLELVGGFLYLGDMLGVDGDADGGWISGQME